MKRLLLLLLFVQSLGARAEIDLDTYECVPAPCACGAPHEISQNFAAVIVAAPYTASFLAGVASAAAFAISEWHKSKEAKPYETENDRRCRDRNRACYTYDTNRPNSVHMQAAEEERIRLKENEIRDRIEKEAFAKEDARRAEKQKKLDKILAMNGINANGHSISPDSQTPKTAPNIYQPIRGQKAKLNTKTCEVWAPDMLHKGEWEIYKDKRRFNDEKRDRSVFADGRLKEKF